MLCGESIYFPYEFKYVLLIYVGRIKNLSIFIYFFYDKSIIFSYTNASTLFLLK